jgi:hypothetical protein
VIVLSEKCAETSPVQKTTAVLAHRRARINRRVLCLTLHCKLSVVRRLMFSRQYDFLDSAAKTLPLRETNSSGQHFT